MKTNPRRLTFSVLILLFVLFIIVTSFNYDYDARLIPLLVGFSTLALVLAVIINEIHPVSILEKMNIDWTENLRGQEAVSHKKISDYFMLDFRLFPLNFSAWIPHQHCSVYICLFENRRKSKLG